eukprot:88201_1
MVQHYYQQQMQSWIQYQQTIQSMQHTHSQSMQQNPLLNAQQPMQSMQVNEASQKPLFHTQQPNKLLLPQQQHVLRNPIQSCEVNLSASGTRGQTTGTQVLTTATTSSNSRKRTIDLTGIEPDACAPPHKKRKIDMSVQDTQKLQKIRKEFKAYVKANWDTFTTTTKKGWRGAIIEKFCLSNDTIKGCNDEIIMNAFRKKAENHLSNKQRAPNVDNKNKM